MAQYRYVKLTLSLISDSNSKFYVSPDLSYSTLCASDTRQKFWQVASLVTQKSLTVTHALFFISRYILNSIMLFAFNRRVHDAYGINKSYVIEISVAKRYLIKGCPISSWKHGRPFTHAIGRINWFDLSRLAYYHLWSLHGVIDGAEVLDTETTPLAWKGFEIPLRHSIYS